MSHTDTSTTLDENPNSELLSESNRNSKIDSSSDLSILYITIGVIFIFLILWIIIVIVTKEDAIKILSEMAKTTQQLTPVSDYSSMNTQE